MKFEVIRVPRKCEGIEYVGLIYPKADEWAKKVIMDLPEGVEAPDPEEVIRLGIVALQSGSHIHTAQALFRKGLLRPGMEIEFTRLPGLRQTKFGHLSKYVDAVRADFKALGHEPSDEEVRLAAQKMADKAEERQEELKKLLKKRD